MQNLISFIGIVILIAIAWVLSSNRKKIDPRPVVGGVILQLIFAALVFWIPVSRDFFVMFSNGYNTVLEHSRHGVAFVFGGLASSDSNTGFILAFQVLPFIIIFAAIMSILYYVGIMSHVIRLFAVIFSRSMKTSGAESLCTASNIFVGVESAITVKPYLSKMTESELFTILVAGMSTVASSIMAAYVQILHNDFPLIAGHLLSASLISAPATFTISKIMMPETETPLSIDIGKCKIHDDSDSSSFMESILTGSSNGARLAIGVGVTLIAFIGLLAIVEAGVTRIFALVGYENVTLQLMLSYIFQPFVFLMGVPPNETWEVAKMLGMRTIMTEVPAYVELAKFAASGGSPRAVLIASYALCGFTHIASIAIFVGGISALAPERTKLLSRLGPKALVAATLVTLMTGCIAGLFYWGQNGIIR